MEEVCDRNVTTEAAILVCKQTGFTRRMLFGDTLGMQSEGTHLVGRA